MNHTEVTPSWIKEKMSEYNISAKEMSQHIGISESFLDTILHPLTQLSPFQKMAFYYYFKYLENLFKGKT